MNEDSASWSRGSKEYRNWLWWWELQLESTSIHREGGPWQCGCCMLTEAGKSHPLCVAASLLPGWDPGLYKWRERAKQRHGMHPVLCFLSAVAVWLASLLLSPPLPANVASPTQMRCLLLNVSKNKPFVTQIALVWVFSHSDRKSNYDTGQIDLKFARTGVLGFYCW